ncbi:MAG: MBL fold metallo-hydrolase [Paludibacter sp.]|nr:MBL fold metallo-hydrolase [Paludibacter sp.]
MTVKTFIFNPFQENTYLVYDENKQAIVFDCGIILDYEKKAFDAYIKDNHINIVKVLNTHLHLDHQFGNRFLAETYQVKPEAHVEDEFLLDNVKAHGAMFGIPIKDEPQPIDAYIIDNQEFEVGSMRFKALHVPGHSPGSVAFYFEEEGCVFVGDVLFKGSIGRTDLPKGDYATLIRSIQNRLLPLPDSTVIYSGHGPATTITEEKANNPYL